MQTICLVFRFCCLSTAFAFNERTRCISSAPPGSESSPISFAIWRGLIYHFDLDAFGYRFAYKGRTIGYTGDTGECSQLNHLLDKVDVAIIELTHPRESNDPGHMDRPTFVELAKWLTAQGSTILATHMSETPDPIPGVEICEDGKTYWV